MTENDFGQKDGGELSEEELAAVPGGTGFCLVIGASDTGCGCVLMGLACYYELVCVGVGI